MQWYAGLCKDNHIVFSMIVTNCLIPSVTAKLSGTRFLAEDNRAVFLLNQYMLVNTSL